jgi:hypothetical protein
VDNSERIGKGMKETKVIALPMSPLLETRLNQALRAGGFGDSIEDCAERLLWQAVRQLVANKTISSNCQGRE